MARCLSPATIPGFDEQVLLYGPHSTSKQAKPAFGAPTRELGGLGPNLSMAVPEHLDQLRITDPHALIDHLDETLTTRRDESNDGLKLFARRAVAIA
jgi:hypothetical protein